MKWGKRILSVLAAVVLSLGLTAGTVFAAPSATASLPTVVDNSNNNNSSSGTTRDRYVVTQVRNSARYTSIRRSAPRVASVIDAVDDAVTSAAQSTSTPSTSTMETLVEQLTTLANSSDSEAPASARTSAQTVLSEVSSGKELVTGFFDIDKTGENVTKTDDGKYLVTLKIPALTNSTKGITLVLYNEDTGEWETVTPTSTDLENQEITLELSSLGTAIVLSDETVTPDNNNNNGNNGSNNNGNNGNGSNNNGNNGNGSNTNGSNGNGSNTNGGNGGSNTSGSKKTTSTGNKSSGSASGSGNASGSGSGSTYSSKGKSPKTADQSADWMAFGAAAVVLAGTGVLVLRRKKA